MGVGPETDKFLYEFETLLRKHSVYPCVMVFHPNGATREKMVVSHFGHPSQEWICGAGEVLYQHVAQGIKRGTIRSGRLAIPQIDTKGNGN